MIITISGVPGSGKTSVGKILAERLGMPFYSVGKMRGKLAMERGLTLDELNALGEKDKTTDTGVDDYQRELGQKQDNFVIEGRLSWYFIPHSFKIYLDCEPAEAARRILASQAERPDEKLPPTVEKTRQWLDKRLASDKRRYAAIYGVDYQDQKNYDLVLNTTDSKNPEETADRLSAILRPRLDAQT